MTATTPHRDSSAVRALGMQAPGYVGYVYGLVLVWGLGDVLSTFFAAAATGGAEREINPMVQVLLAHEPMLVGLLKGAVVLYTGVVLLECRDVVETVPGWRAWFVGVVGAGWLVVLNNTVVGFVALA